MTRILLGRKAVLTDIQLVRDLVIIVSGIVVTVAAIIVAVTMTSIYRKANDILKSTKAAAVRLEALAIIAGDELCKPMLEVAGFMQGIAVGIREIGKLFKKGE